jgi:GTP-binding protein EngB required for normal cell division
MGNENENENKNSYYMCLNLIGESMSQFLICISNDPCESYATQRKKKLSLYDYWDYLYNPELDFFGQLAITMNRLNEQKYSLNLDCKECLIIRVSNIEAIEIQYVLEKVNSLNREHYVPLILFLCNSFVPEDLKKFIFDENKYSKIDQRMIFFEKFEDEIDNEEKMRRIKHRLERFCSYHNELGDIFTIGSENTENDYDLTEMNFPFTVNICCLGRFGKGKSTGVNYILGEKNAKENKSGTSATLKINYYQVSNFPVKIYDLPGFENAETVSNAVKQFKFLNEEIRQLQDQLHIFLYFIKSTDERMFCEMEYSIFKQIFQHKDSYVIYVLTHSSEKTDKKEIYDMINTGIKGVLDKHKIKKQMVTMITQKHIEKYQNLYLKMVATQENCVFVNFHKKNKMPLYGISDFFNKIVLFMERTEAYYRFRRSANDNLEEFQKKIKEEARIRKIRAKALISRHKIGSAIAGFFPGGDYLANKFFIKKMLREKQVKFLALT